MLNATYLECNQRDRGILNANKQTDIGKVEVTVACLPEGTKTYVEPEMDLRLLAESRETELGMLMVGQAGRS